MKKVIQSIGLFSLICFSFFYTEKAVIVVKEQDPIMIKLNEIKNEYLIEPINAVIEANNIIPGYNGREVDVNSSYNSMKRLGMFNANLLVFKNVNPSITIQNNYQKYISNGNKIKKMVTLIFKIKENNDVEPIIKILNEKGVKANFFIDGKWLNNNISNIYTLAKDHEIYNYGYDAVYNKELLLWTNNIINRISNNQSLYCYTESDNADTLSLCSSSKMYTIKPGIITKNNPFNEIKNSINSGSIISFNINQYTIKELGNIIDFIKQKGYNIDTLSNLLSEKRVDEN